VKRARAREDPERLRSELLRIERELVPLPYERAVVLRGDGAQVLAKDGDADAVTFTRAEQRRMRDRILTHNHPPGPGRSQSFSPGDIRFAARVRLREIRVVTRQSRYSMRPTEGGWILHYYDQGIAPLVTRHDHDVELELQHLIDQGIITAAEASDHHWHQVWTRVANETGLGYRRDYWP
jgi:hypothetical protein